MTTKTFWAWLIALGLIALLPFAPEPWSGTYYLSLATKILVYGIFAMSLQLLVGYTGLVSLGHAAFFSAAAYMVYVLTPEYEVANGWWILLGSMAAAALLALVIGALVMRTRGIYFIMVTLAFAQLVYFIFHDVPFFGGSDGTYIYMRPEFSLFGWQFVDLENSAQFYWFVLALLAITLGLLHLILRSRLGHAFIGIKHNEQRMRATGFATVRYKIASFVIGGAFAGLAGCLFAIQYGFVNPELASWHKSGDALMMIILGGLGSMAGAVVGAFAFVMLGEWYQDISEHWTLLLGLTIIAVVVLMPNGLVGGLRDLLRVWHTRSARGGDKPASKDATP
ncbi:MAG: branched-chain amino acid ABC transporter permease [Pigmentiphaga sp.]|nr:branched-chain amino acid ABC transporter permease [Pigmentiphaga sp.]